MSGAALERQLYLSLKAMPCRCAYARNPRGVPVWEGVPAARVLVKRCSRCAAVESYEAAHGDGENLLPTGDGA